MIEPRYAQVCWAFPVTGRHAGQPITGDFARKAILPYEVRITWTQWPGETPRWEIGVTGHQVKRDGTRSAVVAVQTFAARIKDRELPPLIAELVESTRGPAARVCSGDL